MGTSGREACVGVNVLFGEVDVSLGCGVNLDALAGAGTDVGGDDSEGVWIACVPYALFGLNLAGGRANLRAVENGRRTRKRAVGNTDDMLQVVPVIGKEYCRAR